MMLFFLSCFHILCSALEMLLDISPSSSSHTSHLLVVSTDKIFSINFSPRKIYNFQPKCKFCSAKCTIFNLNFVGASGKFDVCLLLNYCILFFRPAFSSCYQNSPPLHFYFTFLHSFRCLNTWYFAGILIFMLSYHFSGCSFNRFSEGQLYPCLLCGLVVIQLLEYLIPPPPPAP